jgi:hypothetical protein
MGSREDLSAILHTLLGSDNVYFQPPPTQEIKYPCIIYKLDKIQARHANNRLYKKVKAYQVTVIDRDPDSDIPDRILEIPKSRFDRFYTADKLNHFVYNIFF